jgi:hypothetical protein
MIFICSFCIGFGIAWVISRAVKMLKKRNAFDMTIIPEEDEDAEPSDMA